MEIDEIELEVSKNQISFDFDSLEEDEESSMLSNVVSAKNLDWIGQEVLFVVIKTYHDDVVKNMPKFDILGKTMLDWVLMAGNHCQTLIIDDGENIIEKLKTIQTDKKIMAVFYSDTPLVDKTLFNEILNYFAVKGFNALKLQRGFVFKVDYLKTLIEFVQSPCAKFDIMPLYPVNSSKMLSNVYKILKNKIIAYHIKNGVVIFDEESVKIDADVEIETGVVVYGNNSIEGECFVSSGVILKSGNVIKDSIIGKDCVIEMSYIEKSKIENGKQIGPFEKIVNVAL